MLNIDFNNSFRNNSSDKLYYFPTNRDESSDPRYYGFVTTDGRFYIIEDNKSNGTTKYVYGKTNYATSWTNRSSLTYNWIYEVERA